MLEAPSELITLSSASDKILRSSALSSGTRSCCHKISCETPASRTSQTCSCGKSAIAVTRHSSRGGPSSSPSPSGSDGWCSGGSGDRGTPPAVRVELPIPADLPGRSVQRTENSNVSRRGGFSTSFTSIVLRAGTRPSFCSQWISSSARRPDTCKAGSPSRVNEIEYHRSTGLELISVSVRRCELPTSTVLKSTTGGSAWMTPDEPTPLTCKICLTISWLPPSTPSSRGETRQGTLARYVRSALGANLQSSSMDSRPRSTPAGQSTVSSPTSFSGISHSYARGRRLGFVKVSFACDAAPTHAVGM